ncbi:MAG: hypothetical protein WCJ25_03130 [Candidatus Moraniibacteriota bacterium]
MSKKNIVISGSASLQKEMLNWVKFWEEKDAEVLAWPVKIEEVDFDVEWPKVHDIFYKAIDKTDFLFVANAGKNGIEGYVGPNTFAEISFAVGLNFIRKRKIRVILQNMPMDESSYGEVLRLWIKNGWMEIFDEKSGL